MLILYSPVATMINDSQGPAAVPSFFVLSIFTLFVALSADFVCSWAVNK